MQKEIEVSGTVSSGTGRGRYFMGKRNYTDQMLGRFSFMPYIGTLNIKVLEKDLHKIKLIKERRGMLIRGFKEGDKTFGDVIAYNAEIQGLKCALLMPKLSKHTDTIEIIAEKRLRDELTLEDGSEVTVRVFLS